MQVHNTFTVTARCVKYQKTDNVITEKDVATIHSEVEDIDLEFDIRTAEKFLFRFYPHVFSLNKYKLVYHIDQSNNMVIGITLFNSFYMYIIKNANQVINEVVAGYKALVVSSQISKMALFNFDAATDLLEKQEEFEEEFDDNNDESIED